MSTSSRRSKGRQKIEMKKMTNESNLQVTFSKRRTGLFKKASELCTLCGAEVALIVFSPGEKVFSFGHPTVDMVVDRFLTRAPQPAQDAGTMQLIEAHRSANVRDLIAQFTQVSAQLDAEKKRSDELNHMRRATQVYIAFTLLSFSLNSKFDRSIKRLYNTLLLFFLFIIGILTTD